VHLACVFNLVYANETLLATVICKACERDIWSAFASGLLLVAFLVIGALGGNVFEEKT